MALLQLSLSDRLLSSKISLPPNPSIFYAKFTPNPTSNLQPHESIEAARRLTLERNGTRPLRESLLTSVHIGALSFIYVFLISSESNLEAPSTLNQLVFDGLIGEQTRFFVDTVSTDGSLSIRGVEFHTKRTLSMLSGLFTSS